MMNINVGELKTKLCTLLQAEILELIYKLKRSEYRGEQAEMNIQRLNVRIDQVGVFFVSMVRHISKISLKDSLLFSSYSQLLPKQVEEDLLSEKYKIKK